MIARLSGILSYGEDDTIIIDVGGIGYLVRVSQALRSTLGQEGDRVSLLIETHMRDNAMDLYGFLHPRERTAFRLLMTVQGVGARLALAVLSTLAVDDLHGAIMTRDHRAFSSVVGVGAKLAARICNELGDRLAKAGLADHASLSQAAQASSQARLQSTGQSSAQSGPNRVFNDALSALCHLGYDRHQAWRALSDVTNAWKKTPRGHDAKIVKGQKPVEKNGPDDAHNGLSIHTLIPAALKVLSR